MGSKDIGPILEGWDHDDETPQARIVQGLDGREKLQLRLDLGLLQLELDGRPDGLRPQGHDSLLDHLEARAEAEGEGFELEPQDCAELMREGIQYYRRYLALFHLGRFELVERDTSRNLRLFAFVRQRASRDRDRLAFDQYRPYVTMMRAQAIARRALAADDRRGALTAVDEGMAGILAFFRDHDQEEQASVCPELNFLKRWRREIEQECPDDPLGRLEDELRAAVEQERFEEAARLRDVIRRLRTGRPDLPADPAAL